MTNFSQFTKKYKLSKTLRFELIPQGKTLEHIEAKGLITNDETRAINYQKMKSIIDDFHKDFIERAFKEVNLSREDLKEYERLYNEPSVLKKEEIFKNQLNNVRGNLRKEIVKSFSSTEDLKKTFQQLGKGELIKKELMPWLEKKKNEDELTNKLSLIEQFKTFTTYFAGFNENRLNMYTDKEQSTAIAYRVVHENLPKFIENIKTYNKIKDTQGEVLSDMKEVESSLSLSIHLDEIFTLEYFNRVISQSGIDYINHIIGGKSTENGQKIKGLNEYINLFNQTVDKSKKLPKFKQLYKQILSDRNSISFLPKSFKTDQELLEAIQNYYTQNLTELGSEENSNKTLNVFDEIKTLLDKIPSVYDINKIYLRNDSSLGRISQTIWGNYSVLYSALSYYYDTVINTNFKLDYSKGSETKRKYLTKAKANYTKSTYISIADLQTALDCYLASLEEGHELKKINANNCIAQYFKENFKAKKKVNCNKVFDFKSNIIEKYRCIQEILKGNFPRDKDLKQDQKIVKDIRELLDSIQELLHFVKPLYLNIDSIQEKDNLFYSHFDTLYEQLAYLTPLYKMVKDYVTQKPFSQEQFKLNFENNGNFLGGWVDSHTDKSYNGTQAGGYLLRKKNCIEEYDYFLGISADAKILVEDKNLDNSGDLTQFERLNYYQLKSASVYMNSYQGENSYSKDRDAVKSAIREYLESLNIEKKESIISELNKKNEDKETPSQLFRTIENKFSDLLPGLLEYKKYKTANNTLTTNLHKTIIGLTRVPKSKYYQNHKFNNFMEAQAVIDDLCKEKIFTYYPIDSLEIKTLQEREKNPLFLFKINNKDLSFSQAFADGKRKKENRGKDNLHTMYFKALMEGNQGIYDIGTAEVFFRRASIMDNKIVHQVGEVLPLKNPIPNPMKSKSTFDYKITKDKRYTEDKFLFHLSIIQNYTQGSRMEINEDVKYYLKNNPEVKIIGLDRGERHLIYLSLIDQQGNILKQESLNDIVSENHPIITPYHTLLDNKEKERAKAREEWGPIEKIKDLKNGYISQVVYKIAKMMVTENAIVVMEDLNTGFKRGRFHVEKQVYQNLEKKLIDKLNYLVLKNKNPLEPGGLFNALQLTNKFESFKEMRKQSGFLFYIPAWNTSKIDPITGFVDFLKPKYESIEKSKEFFSKFEAITYNPEKDYFEFKFDYKSFTTRADGTKTAWTVCTHGSERFFWNRSANDGEGATEKINVTESLKTLFENQVINFREKDLKTLILSSNSKDLFINIIKLLSITLSMRYSSKDENRDFILSPVANEKGVFFNSEIPDKNLPQDADANGAYHIAKKGLWFLKQLNKTEASDNLKEVSPTISNKEWLNFVQNPLT